MKKIFMALGVAALLAGCASQDRDTNNGMGGTSDQDTMKTDSIHNSGNGGSFNNNANNGTGSDTAPNGATTAPQTTPQ